MGRSSQPAGDRGGRLKRGMATPADRDKHPSCPNSRSTYRTSDPGYAPRRNFRRDHGSTAKTAEQRQPLGTIDRDASNPSDERVAAGRLLGRQVDEDDLVALGAPGELHSVALPV